MFCSQCGAEAPEGKRFCAVCGYPLGQVRYDGEAGQVVASAGEAERMAQLEREQAEALRTERERVLESYEASRDAQTTPVAQVLGDGRVTYEPLTGMDVQASGEQTTDKDAKAELKEAKAAYKSARKAAGKSAAPKVVAVIIAILVAAGAGAGAMWWFSSQRVSATPSQSPASSTASSDDAASSDSPSEASSAGASSDASSASASSASASSGSSSAAAQGGIESYVGTWKGGLVEPTHYAVVYCCYGAEEYPLVLTVKKVGTTGSITADAKLLFHEHESLRDSDAASTDGDVYIELKDLVGTLSSDGSFSFHEDLAERGEHEEVSISAKTVDLPDGTRTLEVTVDSQALGHATDLYSLEKE